MLTVSCSLLNPVLKVKNRMVVWVQMVVSVVYPLDRGADWDLLPLPSITREYVHTPLAQEKIKIQNSKHGFY